MIVKQQAPGQEEEVGLRAGDFLPWWVCSVCCKLENLADPKRVRVVCQHKTLMMWYVCDLLAFSLSRV